MDVTYDEAKFVEMVLYVADRLKDDRAGGATKLNKVLYFADFAHVRLHGKPITGAMYCKRVHGPAPHQLVPVRKRLIDDGDAEIVVDDFMGHQMHRLIPTRQADMSVFSTEERTTIDKVIDDLANLTGKQVSDLSHEEPWWPMFEDDEEVPYFMAFAAKEQMSTPTSRRLGAEIAERYGITTRT